MLLWRVVDQMVATPLAAPHHVVAYPCSARLPAGPAVPAPLVMRTSCGSFRVAIDGRVTRLRPHWLATHGSGSGRSFEPELTIRRNRAGRFFLRERGRLVWRSSGRYPNDGGSVTFGPHSFAFASYRRGVFLTDLHGAERLVARGRGLYPYDFDRAGQLLVVRGTTILLISPQGELVRRFRFRARNGFSFDEHRDTLYYVTQAGRLAAAQGSRVELRRSVAQVDGMISTATHGLLVFEGGHSVTVTRRDGSPVAHAAWTSRQGSDSGVSVSPDGRFFAYRLTDAHPGSRSSTASVYLLRAGERSSVVLYRHRQGLSGCAVGASLSWHGRFLLYRSSDGTTAVLDTRAGTTVDLTQLAAALPRRSSGDRALTAWRSDFSR